MPPPGPLPRPRRHSVEIDVHANVGVVRPGERLVIAVSRMPKPAEQEELRMRMPGVDAVFVEANALVVYRP